MAPLSTREDAREAITAAGAAYAGWRDTPAPARARLWPPPRSSSRAEELARLLTREEGKTLKESLGEVQKAIDMLEFMAGEARRLCGETMPSELPRNFAYTLRQPLGVVAPSRRGTFRWRFRCGSWRRRWWRATRWS